MNLKSLRRYNLSNEIVRIWWESHLGGHCWVPLNNVIKRSFPIQIPNELWYSTGAATGSHKNSLVTFTLGKSKLIQNFLFLLSSAGSASGRADALRLVQKLSGSLIFLVPGLLFCYQNFSDLLWEKNVLNFWNSRLMAENLKKIWDY